MNEPMQPASPQKMPASADQSANPTCAICGQPPRDPIAFATLRPSIAKLVQAEHPNIANDDLLCRDHLADYRTRHVVELLAREKGALSDFEREVITSLAREETVTKNVEEAWDDRRTVGERMADVVAEFGGSWRFIISFGVVILVWMTFNVIAFNRADFDPYPFILLNLVLSCLAALQAPIIMMSQRRQEAKDRLRSENDYRVNLKAELEIRHLHEKMDHLINRQWERLAEIQQIQLEMMEDMASPRR